ncbi:uncharacterized protein LOC128236072 [Mya arenaria]|uniref:uncharacterized protein LOC128236072 n=1 Tax=Mya arenaria TaxID=6604 RepID=UPI0022E16617|nr:uncharacterized protein LOC128236072 [Mya arenaria]
MANTFEKVLNVIGKKPDLRQDFEIQDLLPWLRKKSKLFSTLKTEYLKDIVRSCSVGKYKRDDVIIKQGEIGDCFYIILAGKISIFILNKDRDGGNDGEEKDAFGAIGTLNKDGVLDRSKLGNFVTSLGTGFPFGEVALVSDDAIRTATIVAEEDTDLLVVDRALYNRAVRDVLAAEFEEKQAFIKTNDLFSSWTPKYKKQLTMAMYKEIYCYDSVLVKQGDQVNNIYFIISGQVEIRADTSQHPTQYPKLYKLLEDEREKLIKQKRHKKQHETENVQNIPPSLKKKESTIRKHKMCFLGMNESLGEVEVLMDMDTYMTTAVCTEKTEVIVLEMKHYERLFVKKHQRTIDAMRRRLEVKLNTKTSVLKEYDAIPLLKLLQLKLSLLHNPPQTPEDKKKRNETSVQVAEKLFFNHQGPLLDMDGPGSVFYMIRAREKSRLRLQQHRKDRQEARKNNHFNAHLHSIRLPQSLLMAAQIAIENEAGNDPHFDLPEISLPPPSTRIEVAKRPQNSEIDVVASQNRAELEIIPDPKGDGDKINENGDIVKEKAQENVDLLPESLLRSFRRIQSATKSTSSRSVDHDQKNGTVEIKHEHRIRSLPSSPRLRIERCKTETKLQRLETKVEEWLKKDNPKASAHVSKLRRIQLEEMETPPKPGNKIVVRRRSRGVRNDKTTHTGIGSSEFTGSALFPEKSFFSPQRSNTNVTSFANSNKEDRSLDRFKILLTN